MTKERVVKKILDLIKIFDFTLIDGILNNPEAYFKLIDSLEHPLNIIYRSLELDPETPVNEEKQRNYQLIKRIVELYKSVWEGDEREIFKLLKSSHLNGNSVMYILRKK